MSCSNEYEHVKVPIPEKDWKCPKCGVGVEAEDSEGWVIYDCVNYDCEFLHDSDTLVCGQCGHGMTGEEYSRWYAKKKSAVKCPCCRGEGTVSKKKAEEYKRCMKKGS